MLTKQGSAHEKSRKTPSIGNNRRTIARDQYQYYWTITKLKWKRYNSGYSESIYQDGQA